MKIRILNFVLVLSLMQLFSCSSREIPEGKYHANFSYKEPQGHTNSALLEIKKITSDSILVNNSILRRDGDMIEGHIVDLSFSPFGITVKGRVHNPLFKGEVLIKGEFTESYFQNGKEYENKGVFEFKSNYKH